ncbi:hypothetical protein ANN_15443 [Periplaneta americana]|uniref:Uncharacterized protein n=1 Tax=Periplaneta americana TaxID=6978 RepID=A0ABQ8SH92_PERAM|nr:hypothetical protein ANN_15443 [Periplaneta americana]
MTGLCEGYNEPAGSLLTMLLVKEDIEQWSSALAEMGKGSFLRERLFFSEIHRCTSTGRTGSPLKQLGVWREGDHVIPFDSVRHVLLIPTSDIRGEKFSPAPGMDLVLYIGLRRSSMVRALEVISASSDVPEFCPAGVLLHASKSTDMSLAIDLARDRTRNPGHRRPALYQLANQTDIGPWGKLKSQMYSNNPHTLEELQQNIENAIAAVPQAELLSVSHNLMK